VGELVQEDGEKVVLVAGRRSRSRVPIVGAKIEGRRDVWIASNGIDARLDVRLGESLVVSRVCEPESPGAGQSSPANRRRDSKLDVAAAGVVQNRAQISEDGVDGRAPRRAPSVGWSKPASLLFTTSRYTTLKVTAAAWRDSNPAIPSGKRRALLQSAAVGHSSSLMILKEPSGSRYPIFLGGSFWA
jgi:hypothetical protein